MFSFHPIRNCEKPPARGWQVCEDDSKLPDYILKFLCSPFVWQDGHRRADNFLAAPMIAVDVDDGWKIDDAIDYARQTKVKTIIGTTKSHQIKKNNVICDRYRVWMPYATPVNDPGLAAHVAKRLIDDYRGDIATKDLARCYYPCREIVYNSWESAEKTINPLDFTRLITDRKAKAVVRVFWDTKAAIREKKRRDAIKYGIKPKLSVCVTEKFLNGENLHGQRNIAAFKTALALMHKGCSDHQAFERIWNSAIPIDRSEEVRQEIWRCVKSASKYV